MKGDRLMKLLSHPHRLRIILMLLKRDHCVCEFFYVFKEPQNLISHNLIKNSKMAGSLNRITGRATGFTG